MSGHSKWHSIRHKKGANDAARGKIFTRHAKIITIAARDGGGDPDMNPALRIAIENAKKENMPNNNIDRAIKKGTGEDKDAVQLMELVFEGYAPEGVAVLVQTITDNRNRTVASVRSIFNKNGGNMAANGAVSYMFHQKGRIEVEKMNDDIELIAIDNGAEDISGNEIFCSPKDLEALKKALKDVEILDSGVSLIPKNTVRITDETKARQIIRLISALEEDEDVSQVSANFDIPDDILEKVME